MVLPWGWVRLEQSCWRHPAAHAESRSYSAANRSKCIWRLCFKQPDDGPSRHERANDPQCLDHWEIRPTLGNNGSGAWCSELCSGGGVGITTKGRLHLCHPGGWSHSDSQAGTAWLDHQPQADTGIDPESRAGRSEHLFFFFCRRIHMWSTSSFSCLIPWKLLSVRTNGVHQWQSSMRRWQARLYSRAQWWAYRMGSMIITRLWVYSLL